MTKTQLTKDLKAAVAEHDKLPEKHEARNNPDLMVERTEVDVLDMPPITKVINRVEVVFNGAYPLEKINKDIT